MEKFSKEFYSSRIEDWVTKYIKVKELIQLIKSIEKDIEKNGGQIIRISDRKSTLYMEEFRPSRLSVPLDRHSVGLEVLEGTEGLFNKNEKIFHTPLMYEINEIFKEIENLEYCDDIKIFLYFLTIEVHNVYVFYLSIEKNIFMRVNEHSYTRQKYENMKTEGLLEELVDFIDITYLMYSFYSYIDLNIEAIHEILKYFDDHFQILNHDISMHKLFFKKYLNKKESDLKYILSFKIIIESSALIESYYHEILQINNTKEIKAQVKELKEVLYYLNEKNTDRVNDDIYEVYLKQKQKNYNNIIKLKKNITLDIQNSFFIGQQEDYYKRLEEKQYDEEINIKATKKNIINLILLYSHTFFYSFFYIVPYISFYFYFVENKLRFHFLGFILASTHLGNFLSKLIINFTERYKSKLIYFCICFLFSFALSIFSEIFLQKNINITETENKIFLILNLISRFIYGFSGGRLITRKYIILYLPESEIKYHSLIYLIIIYFGILFGVVINFVSKIREPLTIDFLPFEIQNYLSLFCIGFIISFINILIILCFFTEPTKESMIRQNRITVSTKDETRKDSLNFGKNISKYENTNEEQKNDKIKGGLYRSYNKENKNKNITIKRDINNINRISSFNEIEYKTYNDNNNRLNINKIESRGSSIGNDYIYNKEDLLDTPLNISLLKRESNNDSNNINNINELNNINKDKINKNEDKNTIKKTIEDDIMSAEEIKGLNSIEKNIINMNTNNNYNDVNLLPEELDRIKKNQSKNNRSYLCVVLVFIISLLLTNSLNEYILLSIPLCFIKNNDNNITIYENEVILSFTILTIFSFPFIIFFRIMKVFVIERKLLFIFYLILYFFIIGFAAYKYYFYNNLNENIYSLKNLIYRFGIIIIFILCNLIEGTAHLLSDKLIPSFVKICHINNKYLISYSSVLGKILGASIFCGLCIMDNNEEEKKGNFFEKTNIFKKGIYIFCGFTLISFFVFCLCYKSLRVRAISKLFYVSD